MLPLSLTCVCKSHHRRIFIIPREMCWVCMLKILFPKELFVAPEPEAEMDIGACSAIAGKWETFSESFSTCCEFVLINQPLPKTAIIINPYVLKCLTDLWKEPAAHPTPVPPVFGYRERTGIEGPLSKRTHYTCLVNTSHKHVLNPGLGGGRGVCVHVRTRACVCFFGKQKCGS